ncbi:flagellar biosynthesis anti-sigma factor FlgM [Legionella drancourtii]|uniref:Negative regulator of flagellin synthesis n=1 Tax=Legionella drancourtii LLAP12 TaxID=658187 RepID=G9EKY0_9GAMM|nr:flagellar biosynthesis anti-sigma factor FlgM [Legionella drancourtii]EHL32091.1 negative regulator of flagellin synthesis [Legionella drancourtii LLAP12]
MFNQISDSAHLKPIESDTRLKSKQLEINKILTDGASSFDDSVSISNTSKQLEAIKKSLQEVPEINEARVLYFKAEIELGNYKIDSDKIATKMLNDVEMA